MIDLIVIVISAIVFVLLLVWWRWPAFRAYTEAPKYSMLRQERRFDDRNAGRATATPIRSMAPGDS
jgi:hypothetical protein